MKLIVKLSVTALICSIITSCTTAPEIKASNERVIQTKQAPISTTKNTENENGLICKKDAVVGTRFKSKRCLTREQWAQRARDGKELTGAAQDKGSRNMRNPDG